MLHKLLPCTLLVLSLLQHTASSGQGISFSYLIPTKGKISAPVSPFSIRGIGIGNRAGIETGATLYSISGLPMDQLPFSTDKPFIRQHFALLVPLEAYVQFRTGNVTTKLLGGGFALWHINPQLNYGNIDRAIRDYENWEVANADLDLDSKLGLGWMTGLSFTFRTKKNFALITEVQYLNGASVSALSGSYVGGNSGEMFTAETVNYRKSRIILQGIEVSIGVEL